MIRTHWPSQTVSVVRNNLNLDHARESKETSSNLVLKNTCSSWKRNKSKCISHWNVQRWFLFSYVLLLWPESPSGKRAMLHPEAASNNRGHTPCPSFSACLRHKRVGAILGAYPIRDVWPIEHRAYRVAATIFPFLERTASNAGFIVKFASGTAFTSWLQQHFIANGKPERHVRKTSHCISKQQ